MFKAKILQKALMFFHPVAFSGHMSPHRISNISIAVLSRGEN